MKKKTAKMKNTNYKYFYCSIEWLITLLFINCLFVISEIKTAPSANKPNNEIQLANYLTKYGYLDSHTAITTTTSTLNGDKSEKLVLKDTLTQAIEDLQSFANLNVTGKLDSETIELINTPRCGTKDKFGKFNTNRPKREIQGTKWKTNDLTYVVSKYPRKLNPNEVDEEISKAFAVWSEYTPLTFTKKTSGPVHIDIRFESYDHGDEDPFDGPGGTLAHAYFPIFGGDAHFDDSEKWTIKSYSGTNFFQVAAHEFGHSLGLEHSNIKNALMAPYYRGYKQSFKLHEDDIDSVQSIYGKKMNSVTTTKPFLSTYNTERYFPQYTTRSSLPDLCSDPKFDAIFSTPDRNAYVFKGSYCWKLSKSGIAFGYPKLISEMWSELPSDIDAAFTYKNGKTYFFKRTQYWKYNGFDLEPGYPKAISEGFSGIPDNVQGAMMWPGNGYVYFFKGSKFWKHDPQLKASYSNYPKSISNWEGIPDDIDDVFACPWTGITYFFKDGDYWRFDDDNFRVDQEGIPPFPRKTYTWWFGCKEKLFGENNSFLTKINYNGLNKSKSKVSVTNTKIEKM